MRFCEKGTAVRSFSGFRLHSIDAHEVKIPHAYNRAAPSLVTGWTATASQYLWYSYFSFHNRIDEGLGELVATTPMLNSLGYSIGAVLATAVGRSRTRARDPHQP